MNLDNYPRTKKLMENTGLTLNEVYELVEKECIIRGWI